MFLITFSYQDKLCGLCGDYNGDVKDDFRKPDGLLTPNANDFGHSWNTDPEWELQMLGLYSKQMGTNLYNHKGQN